MTTDKAELIKEFYDGAAEGVALYAHWKDGVQYVGTTGKTLKLALAVLEEECNAALEKAKNE